MHAIVLTLLLSFSVAQTVQWADCCCGTFCEHKNACTGCPPGDACPGGEKASCCGEEESPPKETCSHLEPSSEVTSVSADALPEPPAATIAVTPVYDLPLGPHDDLLLPAETGPPPEGPSSHVPLHLYLAVLRI